MGGGDRRRGIGSFGVNLGRPIVTNEDFATRLFPNYFGQDFFTLAEDKLRVTGYHVCLTAIVIFSLSSPRCCLYYRRNEYDVQTRYTVKFLAASLSENGCINPRWCSSSCNFFFFLG